MAAHKSFKAAAEEQFKKVQAAICTALEIADGRERFISDSWERPDHAGSYGGGGNSRVLKRGGVFEQAGVNFSSVEGTLIAEMSEKLVGVRQESRFFATGISLVIHPLSPLVPTTHANFRYLEVADKMWFGGGMDLTPYVLFEEDAAHFHSTIKNVCDRFDVNYYPRFKKWCDEYFYLPHRKETRGIGGIFFDYLGRDEPTKLDDFFPFVQAISEAFVDCYVPIVERRKALTWSEEQKNFQLIRRGRYVEFNLLYDRGTLFGLKTSGRSESILMSLPPEVRWEYNYQVGEGSDQAKLLEVLQKPRDWV